MIWQEKKVYEETFWNKTKSARLSADNKGFHSYIFFYNFFFFQFCRSAQVVNKKELLKLNMESVWPTNLVLYLYSFLRVKKSRKGIISFPLNLTQANETCIYLRE